MALYDKYLAAWQDADFDAWIALLHDDWEMTYHSSGRVSKKIDLERDAMTKMLASTTIADSRCIYENDDILIMHNKATFASGDREAIMHVNLKKDGLIWRTETGATPLK